MVESSRTGRPIKGNYKRDQQLNLRVTAEELSLIDECAAVFGWSRTDIINLGIVYVRDILITKKVKTVSIE